MQGMRGFGKLHACMHARNTAAQQVRAGRQPVGKLAPAAGTAAQVAVYCSRSQLALAQTVDGSSLGSRQHTQTSLHAIRVAWCIDLLRPAPQLCRPAEDALWVKRLPPEPPGSRVMLACSALPTMVRMVLQL